MNFMKILLNCILIYIFSLSIAMSMNRIKNFNDISKLSIQNIQTKIGIVDFRNILKNSKTMKIVGKEYLKYEKLLNTEIKNKEIQIRNKETDILKSKDKISKKVYNERKKKLKQEITKLQKFALDEKNKLKYSFQKIQKKLNDVLANIIKDISKKRGIDIVVLKENIFLYNNTALNLSSEALKVFDEKTKNLKITAVNSK